MLAYFLQSLLFFTIIIFCKTRKGMISNIQLNMNEIDNIKQNFPYQQQPKQRHSVVDDQSSHLLMQFKIYIIEHLIQQLISRKLKSMLKRLKLNFLKLQGLSFQLNQTPKNKYKTNKYSQIKLSTPINSNIGQQTYFEQYRGESSYYYPSNAYDSKYTTPRHHLKTNQAVGSARSYNLHLGKQSSIRGSKHININYDQFYDMGRFKSRAQQGNYFHQRIKTSNAESPYADLDMKEIKVGKGSVSRENSKKREKSSKFNQSGCIHKKRRRQAESRRNSVTKLLYLILKRIYCLNLECPFELLIREEENQESVKVSEGKQTYFEQMTQQNVLLKESVDELKDQIYISKSELEIKTRQLKQISIRFEHLSKFGILGQLDWCLHGWKQMVFEKLILLTGILQGKQRRRASANLEMNNTESVQESKLSQNDKTVQFQVIYDAVEKPSPDKNGRREVSSKYILPIPVKATPINGSNGVEILIKTEKEREG